MATVYSSGKIFHFPGKLESMSRGEWSAPIHVRLKPTNRCNHNCSYCCFRNSNLLLSEKMDVRDEIPPEKMREVTRDLVEMNVRAVTLSGGGEPLCYPHVVETVRALLDGGVKVAALTNGGLLRGEIAGVLARRATWVRVSMDAADAELYAATRDCPPSEFDRVCDNIRDFAKTPGRTCTLGLNFIVTRENSRRVPAFLRMAKELGVDHVKVSAVVVSTQPDENAAYVAPFFDAVKKQLAECVAELAGGAFSVVDKFHMPEASPESFRREYTECPMSQWLTVIAADQNVYTCQDKAYTSGGLLGSIRDRTFRDLWFSDELRGRLRELNPALECRHHCVAHGKNLMLHDYFEADQEHLDFV